MTFDTKAVQLAFAKNKTCGTSNVAGRPLDRADLTKLVTKQKRMTRGLLLELDEENPRRGQEQRAGPGSREKAEAE